MSDLTRVLAPLDPEVAGGIEGPGGRLWYRLNGARHLEGGRLPLIALHGGPGFSHHYLLTLTDLADERPVVLYDQLDCGNSERPGDPANWTPGRFVDEVEAVRRALGFERFVLFGNSWGGTLAAEYAMRQPAALAGLVLSSPLISTARWLADNAAYRQALPSETRATLDAHEAAGTTDSAAYEEAVMVFYRRHLCRLEPWPQEMLRAFEMINVELYMTMWGNTEFNATGTLKDHDGTARLGRIAVPTLYTCGEFDECAPSAARAFAALTPKARLAVIPEASHTAHLEQRETYVAELRAFLAGLD